VVSPLGSLFRSVGYRNEPAAVRLDCSGFFWNEAGCGCESGEWSLVPSAGKSPQSDGLFLLRLTRARL
jgi:hypothetical protein